MRHHRKISFFVPLGLTFFLYSQGTWAQDFVPQNANHSLSAWSKPQWGFLERSQRVTQLRPPRTLAPQLLVIEEESLLADQPHAIPGAKVHWVSLHSHLTQTTDASGYAHAPYPYTVSARFVVTHPGYIPAVGYVIAGHTTPVVLWKESRLPSILKSLGLTPQAKTSLILGKVLRKDLSRVEGVSIVDGGAQEASVKTYYSLGSFGLFHPAARTTGAQGDFLIAQLPQTLRYLLPSNGKKEWPAWSLDLSSLPSVVSLTLSEPIPLQTTTEVVDAWALERPPVGIHALIGGQSGLSVPDESGELVLDPLFERESTDLIEVSAQGYQKTWLSTIAQEAVFPSLISLFTQGQLSSLFAPLERVDLYSGMILGHLEPERYTQPVSIKLFDSSGRQFTQAQIHYFDTFNRLAPDATQTEVSTQNFALTHVPPGEWHVVLVDPQSRRGLGIQAVKTQRETTTQIQF